MEIDVLARIQNLKERIFKLTGFPTQLFQLKCNGAVLETSMTIARYKLNEKS